MKNSLLATLIATSAIFGAWSLFSPAKKSPDFPAPTNDKKYREKQDEGKEEHERREAWIEHLHKAAPGTDWKETDKRSLALLSKLRKGKVANRGNETFADGQIEGEWIEKGSRNQAGSMRTVDYDPVNDKIYGISDGGCLWKGELDGSQWTILNDDIRLHPEMLKAVPNDTGGIRIIASVGKDIVYSDDEGTTWANANMSPAFYDGWGYPMYLEVLNDTTQAIYYMAYTWDSSPWAPRIWLYWSTDHGESFSRIRIFNHEKDNQVSMWSPFKSQELYILNKNQELLSISQDTLNLVGPPVGLPANADLLLTGNKTGQNLTLYALVNSEDVYVSIDTGLTWSLKGSVPYQAWSVGMICSPFDAETLITGEVDCHRSYDGGETWTTVNEWWEYYGNIDLLHADIMDLKGFEKSDGTPFLLIANHAGLHVSFDNLATTQNIGLQGLNISQYYDVVTNPLFPDYIYAGSQDQGWQWTANGTADGPVDFIQQWSGDYGMMALTNNYQSFWTQYPGGIVSYYHYASSPLTPWPDSEWEMTGDDLPAVGWILPTAPATYEDGNTVFIGGGNLYGGPGSYLIGLTAYTTPPFDIEAFQFDYDFKQNSNTGQGLISAIEQSSIDPERIFVSTDDGTFFYTHDGGGTWNKSVGFSGPTVDWIYTASILSSRLDPNVLWISGSGYSNPPVFKSTDGGQSFIQLSDGLPPTLIQEIVANPDESLLFAASAVGPFVFVAGENKWYDLIGEQTPLQWYTCVEYIESEDIVRFGTYGRGIWDFKINTAPSSIPATLQQEMAVTVYPNPASSSGKLFVKTEAPGKLDFTLQNNKGERLRKAMVNGQIAISLQGLHPGVYVFSTSQNGRAVQSGKIIIQ
ncbi:MAG: T9SS type A sorting domain-containing protein [Saprospiraceae bacterium]